MPSLLCYIITLMRNKRPFKQESLYMISIQDHLHLTPGNQPNYTRPNTHACTPNRSRLARARAHTHTHTCTCTNPNKDTAHPAPYTTHQFAPRPPPLLCTFLPPHVTHPAPNALHTLHTLHALHILHILHTLLPTASHQFARLLALVHGALNNHERLVVAKLAQLLLHE